MALTTFNQKNNGVNVVFFLYECVKGVQREKELRQRRATGRIAAFVALNRKNAGVNGFEPEKWRR